MTNAARTFDLALPDRPEKQTLTVWLYREICRAIATGKLPPGTRIPSTREFARQHGISRGTVVTVFEQLHVDGYFRTDRGAGTWVDERLVERKPKRSVALPLTPVVHPGPMTGLRFPQPARPFRMYEPAIDLFPHRKWARIAGRHLNRSQASVLLGRDRLGFQPLRKAIASYLGSSRGAACDPDQIFILSGVQQCLDLIARILVKPGRGVWMEDPGYFGALLAFQNAGAKILPVPVDEEGLNPAKARGKGKVAYITPAHQFPTGVTMSARRRFDVLSWARRAGCYLIEDDYDSEYRFGSSPVPSLKSLDDADTVILVGSFNKLMFSALRIGYIVAPPSLVAPLAALRYAMDLNTFGVEQAILADFIEDGALGRHLRRMREAYGNRFAALQECCHEYLEGALELCHSPAGLFVPALLRNGMNSQQAEQAALAQGIETLGMHRFTLRSRDRKGILLGFGAFDEKCIRAGVITLAKALT